MITNNNGKICRQLVRRDFKFNKAKNLLLVTAIALVCTLFTFAFLLGSIIQNGYLYQFELAYGSVNHIQFYDLTTDQANAISQHRSVKSTVQLSPAGILSDDVMAYRKVRLAAASPGWAKNAGAIPTQGRMPASDDEIAMDATTLDSLGIPHKLGSKVTIRWQPSDGSKEQSGTFRLCGWWDSIMSYTESCAWITSDAANALSPQTEANQILGVTLHRPRQFELQAESIAEELQLAPAVFTTNLADNETRRLYAFVEATPYFFITLFVMLCGILMIYNIVHISAEPNMLFFVRLKSLGMTPRQIGWLVRNQACRLCLFAVPIGWLLGLLLTVFLSPLTIVGMTDIYPTLYFFRLWPFFASGFSTCFAAITAWQLSSRVAAKAAPAALLEQIQKKTIANRTKMHSHPRPTTLSRLALDELTRKKGRTTLTVLSLFLSLILLCISWTEYISYDEEKYMAGASPSDYLLADSSATNDYQRYNCVGQSITPQIADALKMHPAVTDFGTIRTAEQPMTSTAAQRAPIIETFEGRDDSGMPRKQYMQGNPNWMSGYETLRETGDYIGIITGIDGLALEIAMHTDPPNEGTFDAAQFASGAYVVAVGASASGILTTPPVGSKVTIQGREFTIMASQPDHTTLITGSNSPEAEFNVSYYLPADVFTELFPENGIRNVVFQIDQNRRTEFEDFLTDLLADTNIHVIRRSDFWQNFISGRLNEVMISFLVGSILLLIGILNFGNMLVSKMLLRKKEFAIYESLGMTKQELKQLLLLEGLFHAGILALFLTPSVLVITGLWGKWWMYAVDSWCVTYRSSLAPLWIVLPVLILMAILIPLACMHFLTRESLTTRLQLLE